MVRLTILTGPNASLAFTMAEGRVYTVGRSKSCDVRIPDSQVSRVHCQLEARGERWTVRDLKSSNGTFVNTVQVHEQPLQNGDQIQLGTTVFLFEAEEPAQVEAAPGDAAATQEAAAQPLAPRCARCGKELPADAEKLGQARAIDGKLYCSRCVLTVEPPGADDEQAAGQRLFELLDRLEEQDEEDKQD